MVNAFDVSTKGLLLFRLRKLAGTPVSGEALAAELGVSRVAVWKAANALREAGYAMEASEAGYSLDTTAAEDFLHPWEFGARESRFRHYAQTTSTMDRARELAERGTAPFTVVTAEKQSAGRGRAGRLWESEDGGLFFTLMLPGGSPVLRYALVSAAAQLAAADALRETSGVDARPRWPNDVYVADRKAAGVLVELEAEGDLTRRMAVGIGVNVNNRPQGAGKVSLAELTGRAVSRRAALTAFLDAFEHEYSLLEDRGAIAARWNARAYGVGARVALIDARHTDGAENFAVRGAGVFRGMDELGRAMVETSSGIEYAEAGSASLRY